jgi:hypothetical protein
MAVWVDWQDLVIGDIHSAEAGEGPRTGLVAANCNCRLSRRETPFPVGHRVLIRVLGQMAAYSFHLDVNPGTEVGGDVAAMISTMTRPPEEELDVHQCIFSSGNIRCNSKDLFLS